MTLPTVDSTAASSAPLLKDLTIDNITSNVHAINSQCPDDRFRFLLEKLVTHLHDFARETRLSTKEWMSALQFLTQVGQTCSDVRQEFILLSDVLGLSILVDSIDHPTTGGATEATVLGPFHTHEAQHAEHGGSISSDQDGEPLLVLCTLKDTHGKPVINAEIDIWETDSHGFYDVQHGDRQGPDGRAILSTNESGDFWFKAIMPVSYPIPHDGPVGQLLQTLKRHPYRPSHMHFKIDAKGYEPLVTALYIRGDPYETSDAVFGVKESLIVEPQRVTEKQIAERYSVEVGTSVIKYDFVVMTEEEAVELRREQALKAGAQ